MTRHEARAAALQILYFCEVGRVAEGPAIDAFFSEHEPDADEGARAFAEAIVRGTMGATAEIDALIARQAPQWRPERLAIVDRLILRLGTWELLHQPETPAAVVLNEAVELAREFSTDEAVKFVNGVLDGIRRRRAAGE